MSVKVVGEISIQVVGWSARHNGEVCHNCKKVGHFAKACRSSRQHQPPGSPQPATNAISIPELKAPNISALENSFERAPTIGVHISSLNGSANLNVLPDSGADISVAGLTTLKQLRSIRITSFRLA